MTQQSSRSCSLTQLPIFSNSSTGCPSNGDWRTKFKLACLTYIKHCIGPTSHPPYLAELLQYYKPARSTRSSASHSLSVPSHNLSFGSRALRIKIWNSLPPHILQSQTLSSFRHYLKTHYFQSAYPVPQHSSPMRPDSLLRLWRYINHLLTYLCSPMLTRWFNGRVDKLLDQELISYRYSCCFCSCFCSCCWVERLDKAIWLRRFKSDRHEI